MPETVVWLGLAATPAVVGVMEVLKQAFNIPPRFVGLISLVLAVAAGAGYGYVAPDLSPLVGGAQGVTVGLAASGAWSTTRTVINGYANGAHRRPPVEEPPA